MKKDFIPENKKGKQLNLEIKERFNTIKVASEIYAKACHKLLHPRIWKPITGALSADFDGQTSVVNMGDYIQIDIPAPGLNAGDGHDWVKVEALEENIAPGADESFGMTVQVCENPQHPERGTAHFFEEGASSTFIIKRAGRVVAASYHGRNELPNLENERMDDKLRNAVVAIGAMAGASAIQWNAFLKGLLDEE